MEFVELVSPTRLDNSAAKTGREPCLKVNAGSVMCEVRNDELSTPDAREDPIRNIVIVMDTVDPYTYARTWTVSPFAVLVACLAFGIIGDAVSRSMLKYPTAGVPRTQTGLSI